MLIQGTNYSVKRFKIAPYQFLHFSRTLDGNMHPLQLHVEDTGTNWVKLRLVIQHEVDWKLILEALVTDNARGTVSIDDIVFHQGCPE
jgi:hypothetical protein